MENEKKQVFQSKPITLIEQKLQEKLVEDIANQANEYAKIENLIEDAKIIAALMLF